MECFYFNRRRYGSRHIAARLKLGRFRVRTAMQRENLRAIAPKRFVPRTTDSKPGLAVSPNLLKNPLDQPSGRGKAIVGDITYLRVQGSGFCYLACLHDKFTRLIVGWKVSERITALVGD
jgi:transposase InsO family protein